MDINIDDYKILNLNKDPFSTAPDPEFLYQSRQHFGTLQVLESSIKKEQGMSVVLGAPGTGKTTICRQLYRKIAFEKQVTSKILYAHYYDNSDSLLKEISELFNFKDLNRTDSIYDLLVQQFQADGNTISLIIDNGHMIPEFCLNVLNRLSDLESNGRRFFQIIIFANKELNYNIEANPDFESRITNFRTLGPFNFRDTRQMISYRLKMAGNIPGIRKNAKKGILFSYPAMLAIYLATEGYPRKIVLLCHRCIVTMILNRTIRAGWFLVRSSARRVLQRKGFFPDAIISFAMIALPLVIATVIFSTINKNDITGFFDSPVVKNVSNEDVETIKTFLPSDLKNDIEIIKDDANNVAGAFIEEEIIDEPSVSVEHENSSDKSEKIGVEIEGEAERAVDTVALAIEAPLQPELFLTIPNVIGIVEVKRSDTLLAMLEKVYGHSRVRYKKAVVNVNNHISNINALEIGDMIHFPPVEVTLKTPVNDYLWIKVGSEKSLNNAVEFSRKWKLKNHRIKIIPYFSKKDGLHFDIILRELFENTSEAENFISSNTDISLYSIEIVKFPLKNTVYFADPYLI